MYCDRDVEVFYGWSEMIGGVYYYGRGAQTGNMDAAYAGKKSVFKTKSEAVFELRKILCQKHSEDMRKLDEMCDV